MLLTVNPEWADIIQVINFSALTQNAKQTLTQKTAQMRSLALRLPLALPALRCCGDGPVQTVA